MGFGHQLAQKWYNVAAVGKWHLTRHLEPLGHTSVGKPPRWMLLTLYSINHKEQKVMERHVSLSGPEDISVSRQKTHYDNSSSARLCCRCNRSYFERRLHLISYDTGDSNQRRRSWSFIRSQSAEGDIYQQPPCRASAQLIVAPLTSLQAV